MPENETGALVGTLSTTDADASDSHTYVLSGTDQDAFQIEGFAKTELSLTLSRVAFMIV